MMPTRRTRIAGLSAAVGLAAVVNIAAPWDGDVGPPATRVGVAGVELGDETARVVERVSYRQTVERVGDVIVIDGVPRDELQGELAAVWEVVDGIWPAAHRDALAQLSVVREEPRGLVGVVHPSTTGGWILSLDVADLPDRALLEETIVHELSHVITLDRAVFTFNQVDDCDGVVISLGCAAEGSVLARYAQRFWPDDVASGDVEHFVNSYASTSAHEDLSETFTAWVLGWPVEGEVIDAKIALLADDPALAELADSLRAESGSRAAVDVG
jgi:hypothetical protein